MDIIWSQKVLILNSKEMNKIISVAYVILQSAFLACCNGCNQSPAPSYHEAPVREAPKEVLVDTVSEVKQADEEKKDAPVSPASSSVSTSRSTSSSYGSTSSYRYKEKEPDNMRGFDPASEDDMDDNGMSRYMENNDEEGWD